ncbi:response regulator transcription factor [Chryseolinea lacunae]|uniref:Response regulator transcription factor n=1 Tax=Chryseolinea lacunae TaxID=2801331 RepID=A0ABS1KQC5_9BACT|nr:response regulator transcription factor [Chryseolinea lacunae]MBL0741503.1 response regulator transcription factor [Chryseolinea lacunae]
MQIDTDNRKYVFLLAEDDLMVREGFKALLEREPNVQRIYEAGSGDEVLDQLAAHRIDIVLLDAKMPGVPSVDVVRRIVKNFPSVKIVVVSGLVGSAIHLNLLRAGIHGFVQKLNGFDEVRKAIAAVNSTDQYYSPQIVQLIQENVRHFEFTPTVQLTEKEKMLLRGIVEGLPTKMIAEKMSVAISTAETNRSRLLRKTRTQNTAELIAYAFRNGII